MMVAIPWKISPPLESRQLHHFEHEGISSLLAQILFNRGIQTVEAMWHVLSADYEHTGDPMGLVDMPRAVERILRALRNREHITVYGDYDADGVTSAALLFRGLQALLEPGSTLDAYIPHRIHEGFGIRVSAIDKVYTRGTSLLITTDCGSSDTEALLHARKLGIDVIVTDHHHPSTPLPSAYALVNPNLQRFATGSHEERHLSGVGVAFKLVQALFRADGRKTREDERDLLDLVALGTVADVVPLLGDNHTFVRHGLQRLNETRNPGLDALIAVADMRRWGALRERDIAYSLAPRINAAGRVGEASLAFALLTTRDPDEAERLANEMQGLNVLRRQLTDSLYPQALAQAQQQGGKNALLVCGENWHEGVIGILASKLCNVTGKPVLVVSQGVHESKGSARSPQGVNILAALEAFVDGLERYGGHTQAAGCTMRSDMVPALRDHLWSYPWHASSQEGRGDELAVDFELQDEKLLTREVYDLIRTLAPFGKEFPEPLFLLRCVQVTHVSTSARTSFTRMQVGTPSGEWNVDAVFDGSVDQLASVQVDSLVNIIFQLDAAPSHASVRLRILYIEPIAP